MSNANFNLSGANPAFSDDEEERTRAETGFAEATLKEMLSYNQQNLDDESSESEDILESEQSEEKGEGSPPDRISGEAGQEAQPGGEPDIETAAAEAFPAEVQQAQAKKTVGQSLMDHLLVPFHKKSAGAPQEAPASALGPEEPTAPGTPAVTIEDVRALVQQEIQHTQSYLAHLVQIELERARENRRHTTLDSISDMVEDVYLLKGEYFQQQLAALRDEEKLLLLNRERSILERIQDVGHIREATTWLECEVLKLEQDVAQRMAESAQTLAELEGSDKVAGIRQELDQQKAALPALIQQNVEAQLAAVKPRTAAGLGLWPTLLALVLIAAVGFAGILLPRQAEPGSGFLVEMASMYQASGNTEDAIRVLDEAMSKGVSDAATLGQVGEMYRLLKQYDKAINILGLAVQKTPGNENYLLSLARSLGGAGKHPEAAARYQELVKINPANLIYYIEMGNRFRSLKWYDQALAQYQKTLEINSNYWPGYYYQGEVYREQQRYDRAVAQYQKALELNPASYWSQVWLGASYAGQNDPTRAIEHYQEAIKLDSEQAAAYYYLGEAYLAQGAFGQAKEAYQQAVDRNDKYTLAYTGLGNAYAASHDCANAILQFTRVLSLEPKNTDAKDGILACTSR
jgi:tetratricopeptide (TPR) repeat protein